MAVSARGKTEAKADEVGAQRRARSFRKDGGCLSLAVSRLQCVGRVELEALLDASFS